MPKGRTSTKKRGRPPKSKQITQAQLKKALIDSGGFLSLTAERLNVTVANLSQRIKRSDDLQTTIDDLNEKYLDLAESKLIGNIKAGDQRAVEFYLRHKGSRRGYISTDKLVFDQEQPLKIVFERN